MARNDNFMDIMQQRTDAELIEIVTKLRDDYQPEALAAAETEIKNRNLTPEKLEAAEIEVKQKQIDTEQKANEPLDTHWRVLCLLFPGFMNFFLAFIFKGQGQDRKFKEAWRWTFYGFGFYVGLFLLMMLIVGLLT